MILALAGCANDERTAPGTEPAVVPILVGVPVADAVDAVQGAGLRAELSTGATRLPLDGCPGGTVGGQDEPAGTELVRGSTVVLTVIDCRPATATPPP